MERKLVVIGLTVLLVVVGCATLKKAQTDYNTGVTTPLAEGEKSPTDKAKEQSEPIKDMPYGNLLYPIVAFALGRWYTLRRGQSINSGQTPTASEPTKPNTAITAISKLAEMVFEIGPDGSPVKRGWKTVASGLIAYALVTFVPMIHTWAVNSPTQYAAIIVAITGAIMTAEKALSNATADPVVLATVKKEEKVV